MTNPSEQSIESVTIRNILADVSLKAYQKGIMHQSTSNIDTDPYAEKLLALVDKATREAVIACDKKWIEVLMQLSSVSDEVKAKVRTNVKELSNKETSK